MAYMSQENKKEKYQALKKVIPKSWKWSLSVHRYSTLILTIQSAPVDLLSEFTRKVNESRKGKDWCEEFKSNYADVNVYYLDTQFDVSLPIMKRIYDACMAANHNKSDLTTDYYDVGWYVAIKLGRWDKPFICTGATPKSIEAQIAKLERENATMRAAHPQHGWTPLPVNLHVVPKPAPVPIAPVETVEEEYLRYWGMK